MGGESQGDRKPGRGGAAKRGLIILQLNLGRRREAQDLLVATAAERGAGIILVSEPNVAKAVASGWLTDTRVDAAIVAGSATIRECGSGEGVVWVRVEGGLQILSCYSSGNVAITDLAKMLHTMGQLIRDFRGDTIVAGDLNAKSKAWGNADTDTRGEMLQDWAAEVGLVVQNHGRQWTYETGPYGSIIDVTMATEGLVGRVECWQVEGTETLSDHRMVSFKVTWGDAVMAATKGPRYGTGNIDIPALARVFREEYERAQGKGAEVLNAACAKACRVVLRKRPLRTRAAVYWWTKDIAQCRKMCISARRTMTRNRNSHRDRKSVV